MSSTTATTSKWVTPIVNWLTPRRIRAQALVLAICFWGVCIADFATPGLFDRAGNIKFQDFLPIYTAARLIDSGHASQLYDPPVMRTAIANEIGSPPSGLSLPYLYGPQVALLFVPVARLPFLTAASIWVGLSLILYAACVYGIWKRCPALASSPRIITLAALAFPPLFHFFMRGQLSALVLACFTASFLAFRANRPLLAGLCLGLLAFKPQFLVAIPLILLISAAWKSFLGLALSASAQLVITRLYFGATVMRAYIDTLLHPSRWISSAELTLAPIQMHSLRSFWSLLIPWPSAAFVLYALCSLVAIAVAARVWKSQAPIALRFSALIMAAVLINPHLFIYDLLVLAPALLLLANWALENLDHPLAPALKVLAYLAFVLPLFGPLSRWTHLQLSVIAFSALLAVIPSGAELRSFRNSA